MRKYDILLVVGTIAALFILITANIPSGFASTVTGLLTGQTGEQNETNETQNESVIIEKLVDETPEFYVFPEEGLKIKSENFTTDTGLNLKIGEIHNIGDNRSVIVKMTNGKDWVSFNITLLQNDTWNYGLIKELLIVPSHSGLLIVPNGTNYYRYNNQLVVSLNGSDGEIYVYTDKRPTRVVADVSTKWYYDDSKKLLVIDLLSHSNHEITIDWTSYPLVRGTLYVEDKKDIEKLEYKKTVLLGLVEKYSNLIDQLEKRLKDLLNITSTLKEKYNMSVEKSKELSEEEKTMKKKMFEYNQTKSLLEQKMKGKTLLSPLKAVLLGLILIIIIFYIVGVQLGRLSPQKKGSKGIQSPEVGGENEN